MPCPIKTFLCPARKARTSRACAPPLGCGSLGDGTLNHQLWSMLGRRSPRTTHTLRRRPAFATTPNPNSHDVQFQMLTHEVLDKNVPLNRHYSTPNFQGSFCGTIRKKAAECCWRSARSFLIRAFSLPAEVKRINGEIIKFRGQPPDGETVKELRAQLAVAKEGLDGLTCSE